MSEKGDILNQAEAVAARAEENSSVKLRRPGLMSYRYFMGGAYAGEVLQRKSSILEDQEKGVKQVTLEYLDDLDDVGDLGALKHIVSEHGLTMSGNQVNRGMAQMPTWRTYTLTGMELKANAGMGALTGSIVEQAKGEEIKITKDTELANKLFETIAGMEDGSKGRDLYAKFMEVYSNDPDKLSYSLMDHNYGNLDFDEDELLGSMREHLKTGDNRDRLQHELSWLYHYRGKLPATWNRWHNITREIEKAGEANAQLEDTLVEAAVMHPVNHVIHAVYENQRLNTNQLAIVLVQLGGVGWREREVIDEQLKKGVSQEEINQARNLAKEKGKDLLTPILNEETPSIA